MKKLFMFLAVAGLATFGASCSSSDDNGGGEKKKDLVLSGKTDVKEGDAVTFTVKVGDKAEAGADLYVAGEKVSNPYTFTKVGEYKVQAKKKDFNDSNVLTVKVSEKDIVGPGKKTLVLSADKSSVQEGEVVKFTVKDNEEAVVEGYTIKANGITITSTWTPNTAGVYKIVASKNDYNNSNELTVIVTAKEVTPEDLENNKVWYNSTLYDVNASYFELAMTTYNAGTPNAFVGPAVYNFPGGGYANLYYVNVVDFDGQAVGNQGWVAVLVKNPTIVIENNSVSSFGEKVYPGVGNNKVLNGAFSLGGSQVSFPNTSESSLAVSALDLNADEEGTTKFILTIENDADKLMLKYDGSVFIDEYDTTAAGAQGVMAARGMKSINGGKAALAKQALKLNARK